MEALLSATDGLIVRRETFSKDSEAAWIRISRYQRSQWVDRDWGEREDRATTSIEGFIARMGELWKGLGSFDEM